MPHDPTTSTRPASPDVERWLPIAGWPGYDVSDWGRVRSFNLPGPRKADNLPSTPRFLKAGLSTHGYPRVVLTRPGGMRREEFVHKLVLITFVGSRPEGMQGCHYDGDRCNNRLENLRWDTRSGNHKDRFRHGTVPLAKLTEADIPAIWARLVAGEGPRLIAKDYGLVTGAIVQIKKGRSWSHITRDLAGWPLVARPDPDAIRPVRPAPEVCDPDAELWRPFPGYPAYRVCNRGWVESCWKRGKGSHKAIMSGRWRRIGEGSRRGGYPSFVAVAGDDPARPREFFVHEAVLITFVGPRPPGLIACHNDGDKRNNHVGNLRWDTYRSNLIDRYEAEDRALLGRG